MQSLGLDMFVAPEFNIETGKFEERKILDSNGLPIIVNEAEMDIFELARLKGKQSVAEILKNSPTS